MEVAIYFFPIYFGLAFLLAYIGEGKRVGFSFVLIISILLTPIAGLIAIALSKSEMIDILREEKKEKERRAREKYQLKRSESVAVELEKLKKLRDKGILTDAEYNRGKSKLTSS